MKFSANALEYDTNDDVVTATGDVRMFRTDGRLRADKVVWNRKTGRVVATGDVAIVGEEGDTAYGDSIDLTDSLKDGVVDNMLVVLNQGGRLAARRGTRATDGLIDLEQAAYTPCSVTNAEAVPRSRAGRSRRSASSIAPIASASIFRAHSFTCLACRRSRCRNSRTRSAAAATAACSAPISSTAGSTGSRSRCPIISGSRPIAG